MMKKGLIQDIKTSKKRLVDVLPSRQNEPIRAVSTPSPTPLAPPPTPIVFDNFEGKGHRIWPWILLVLVVLFFFGYWLSWRLQSAVLTVVPLPDSIISVDDTISTNALTMMVEASTSKSLDAATTHKVKVSEYASGRIVVENNYSPSSQLLVANTRFEAPDGRIYRIHEPIDVPGYVTTSDNEVSPGRIEVAVWADKPGEDYNGKIDSFTIPGFASNAERFAKITATGASTMEGGFIGEKLEVDTSITPQIEDELQATLKSELKDKATATLPPKYIWYPSLSRSTFENVVEDGDNGPALTVSGKLSVIILPEEKLSQKLATNRLPGYVRGPIKVTNFSELNITLANGDISTVALDELNTATVHIAGQAKFSWKFDAREMSELLAGLDKTNYEKVFLDYPGMVETTLSVRPPWLNRLPTDPGRITVVFSNQLTK